MIDKLRLCKKFKSAMKVFYLNLIIFVVVFLMSANNSRFQVTYYQI
ncbi:hypothetical protein GXM_07411 [Nostoc sphaeroides CCNUC1]|uniref:Uncharacterized protein n=1 Tax=Nostoc sphaeroides CCNUC1 TaxID=2653204 RepID=A0A5P8WAV0_9NOSO|nr:hypothetical protein GXM_07411 [Nostoc sphaeroides CCNUC1]